MTTRPKRKSTRKVRNLKVKSLAADKAKHVKGGPSIGPWRKSSAASINWGDAKKQ